MHSVMNIRAIILISCLLTFMPALAGVQVTILVGHHKGGTYDCFIAKSDNKTFRVYPTLGGMLKDYLSGTSILESTELIVIDRKGSVRARLDFGAAQLPRSMFLSNGYLTYDTGNLAIGNTIREPKESSSYSSFGRFVRHAYSMSVRLSPLGRHQSLI
jgi:hypothetical protein